MTDPDGDEVNRLYRGPPPLELAARPMVRQLCPSLSEFSSTLILHPDSAFRCQQLCPTSQALFT